MFTFEDKYDEMLALLRKRKRKWVNMLPYGYTWDDVESILLFHVSKKWHLYDQKKSLSHWLARVFSNQLCNLCRNNYLSYAKPCLRCPHNTTCYGMEENHEVGGCSATPSGYQTDECDLYAAWLKSKKQQHNIRFPVSLEHYGAEIINEGGSDLELEDSIAFIKKRMKEELSPRNYSIFIMLHFENMSDEEVATKAGYRTTEAGRKPGYGQIAALKKKFREMVGDIIKEIEDEKVH